MRSVPSHRRRLYHVLQKRIIHHYHCRRGTCRHFSEGSGNTGTLLVNQGEVMDAEVCHSLMCVGILCQIEREGMSCFYLACDQTGNNGCGGR